MFFNATGRKGNCYNPCYIRKWAWHFLQELAVYYLWVLTSLRLFKIVSGVGIVPSGSFSSVSLNSESRLHDLLLGRKTGFLRLVFVQEWWYENFWKSRLLDKLPLQLMPVHALQVRQWVRNPTLLHHMPRIKEKVQRKASETVLLSCFSNGPWVWGTRRGLDSN